MIIGVKNSLRFSSTEVGSLLDAILRAKRRWILGVLITNTTIVKQHQHSFPPGDQAPNFWVHLRRHFEICRVACLRTVQKALWLRISSQISTPRLPVQKRTLL